MNSLLSKRKFFIDLLGVLSASLFFYLASPNYFAVKGWPFFAYIFAVPIFFVFDGKKFLHRMLFGILFSLMAYFMILSWVVNVSPFLFFFFSLLFAVQPIIFSIFFRSNFLKPVVTLFFIPALWVATEAVRSLLIGGYAWTIGHSQTSWPQLIQIADITGAYGISFLILFVNVCLYFFIKNVKNKRAYAVAGFALMVCVVTYGKFSIREIQGDKFSICTIQPNISGAEKSNPDFIDVVVDKQAHFTEMCMMGDQQPDLIVWPETAVTDDFLRDKILNEKIMALSARIKTPLLIGSALLVENKSHNSAVLLSSDGNVQGIYHKKHLLPFHEYFPFQRFFNFFERVFHIKNYDFRQGKGDLILPFQKKKELKAGSVGRGYFGVAICSEEGYPFSLRKQAAANAQFMVAMLNDAWFNSDAAMMMHAQNGIMAAAMFKVPVVRSSNSGLTCAIDRYGRVNNGALETMNQADVFYFNIDLNRGKTFYEMFGDVFAMICIFFVGGVGLFLLKKFLYQRGFLR